MNPVPAFDAIARTHMPPFPALQPEHEAARETSPRIVAIGGGTGLPAVLEGLCAQAHEKSDSPDTVTAIVTVTDDGGSSGRLRRDFGVLPPGDIRNCLVALASADSPL